MTEFVETLEEAARRLASLHATLQVELQSNDLTCRTRAASKVLNVRNYVTFDGTAQSVFIPLADFTGVDLQRVRAVVFSGLTPSTTVLIDNLNLTNLF